MQLELTMEIDAPPATVWNVVTDPARQKEWMKGVVSNELIEGEPHAVGSKSLMTIKEGGRNVEYVITLTEVEPPRHLVIEMQGGPFQDCPMIVAYDLEDQVSTTRLLYRLECTPSRLSMRIAFWLFQGFTKSMAKGFLKRLKAVCEGNPVE